MLLGSMRSFIVISLAMLVTRGTAQVHVDRPIQFTSTDSVQRQIQGLATATEEDGAITLAGDRSGPLQLALVNGTANALTLTLSPAPVAYTDGLLLRFIPAFPNSGAVTLDVNGLGPRGLLRPDLLPITLAELSPGALVEAQYADSVFILLRRAESGCPPGYLPVNERFCVQQAEVDNVTYFDAVRYCTDRGAKLCTWEEYYNACMMWQGTLTGTFDDWEWVDGTADHTHTALQCGRWMCHSERSCTADEVQFHSLRCCYRLR